MVLTYTACGGGVVPQPPAESDAGTRPTERRESREKPELLLRGREASDYLVVTGLDLDGVRVTTVNGQPGENALLIGWDRVAAVRGMFEDEAAKFRELADLAWRARARLERGDAPAAEPLFESLSRTYSGRRGPTAACVAEGLLRCRMHRGVQTSAIGPWLDWVRAAEGGAGASFSQELNSEFADRDSLLVPSLPPIWLNTPAVGAFARSQLFSASSGDAEGSKALMLGALYQAAARFEAGMPPGEIKPPGVDGAVQFVYHIVLSRAGDEAQRKDSRERLRAEIRRRQTPWVEAWCRAAIGRSSLREADPEERLLGVAELLTLPARLPRVNPYLTGIALAESAAELLRHNEGAAAERLRAELMDTFPGHPALEWEPIRSIPGVGPLTERSPPKQGGSP